MKVRIPAHVRKIAVYVAGKPMEEAERHLGIHQVVKLASNENPLGPSPLALGAIREAAARVNRYPDSLGYELRQALSRRLGFPTEQIVLGNGAGDLLQTAARCEAMLRLHLHCGVAVAELDLRVVARASCLARHGERRIIGWPEPAAPNPEDPMGVWLATVAL